MIRRLVILAFTLLLLNACAQQEGNDSIKTPGNGGKPGNPDKPSNVLHRHVMLTLAGWADLHSLIQLLSSTETKTGCITKSDTKISWRCPLTTDGKIGRVGEATVSRTNGTINVTTPALGLYNQAVRGGHVLRGSQDYELTLVPTSEGYRFRYQASVEVPTGNSRSSAHYRFDWDLSGTVTTQSAPWSIRSANGSLTVLTFARSGTGGTAVQFSMNATDDLAWDTCGAVAGKFAFSGDKQDMTTVNADFTRGVRSEAGGRGYPWALCSAPSAPLYGLSMTAPFWAQPAP